MGWVYRAEASWVENLGGFGIIYTYVNSEWKGLKKKEARYYSTNLNKHDEVLNVYNVVKISW